MTLHPCPGCGARFPESDGPIHEYMESSPSCWQAFGQVLAREYADPTLFAVHRLSVDSYAVQHPGGTSRQAIQSVGMHLARLCLFLERGLTPEEANAAMLRVGKTKISMHFLVRPQNLGSITVAEVFAARETDQHVRLVRQWARAAWDAWSEHHKTIRRWANAAQTAAPPDASPRPHGRGSRG